jgi:uncharacterized protein YndB with AHSA1/START domain
MTTQTRPDDAAIADDAPVVSSVELEIDAPIDTVWRVLTAIGDWPTWNPDVTSVSIEGAAVEGASFQWKAGPGTIRSSILRVDQPRLITWSGKTLGIRAIHTWRLEQRNGATLVRTEESYEGLVARVLRRSLQKTLDRALADGVRHLKIAAEHDGAFPGER